MVQSYKHTETLAFAEYNLTISTQLENLDGKTQWTLNIKYLEERYKTNTSSNVMNELKEAMLPENEDSDTTDITIIDRFIKNLAAKEKKETYEQKILDLLLQHKAPKEITEPSVNTVTPKTPIITLVSEHPKPTSSKKITPTLLAFKLSTNRQELLLTKNPVKKDILEDLVPIPEHKKLNEIIEPQINTKTQSMFKPSPCYKIILEDKTFWFEKNNSINLKNSQSIYPVFNMTREEAYQLLYQNKQKILPFIIDSIKEALFTQSFVSSINDGSILKKLFLKWQDELDNNNNEAELIKQEILTYAKNDAVFIHYLETEVIPENEPAPLSILYALSEIKCYELFLLESSNNKIKTTHHQLPTTNKASTLYILYDRKTESYSSLSLAKAENLSSAPEDNITSTTILKK